MFYISKNSTSQSLYNTNVTKQINKTKYMQRRASTKLILLLVHLLSKYGVTANGFTKGDHES